MSEERRKHCPACGVIFVIHDERQREPESCELCGSPYLVATVGMDQPYKASPGWLERMRKLSGFLR